MQKKTKIVPESHWRIEEAGTGRSNSESCFIVVDPTAEIDGILECVKQLRTPEVQKVWVLFDTGCEPLLVQGCLKVVRDVMPGCEIVIKHADTFVIYLIGQLWRRMQAYCERKPRK